MKLLTSKQMHEIDRLAEVRYRISPAQLMENAGKKTAEIAGLQVREGEPILVVAGKGNNGGDGLVAARYLMEAGFPVEVVLLGRPEALSPVSAENLKALHHCKVKGRSNSFNTHFTILSDEKALPQFGESLKQSKYIIDAIFGTGLTGEVKGLARKVIEMINASKRPILSIDIPSGLSADTGKPQGIAVRARVTVTFGLPKIGHVLPPGPDYVRELRVVDIGFPPELIDSCESNMHLITPEYFRRFFAPRETLSHKGDFGRVLILAGSTGKMGAGWLASKAALRSGAGLVTYALPDAAFSKFDARFSEIMVEPVHDKKKGYFIPDSIPDIKRISHGKDAAAFGPGIGTREETAEMARNLVLKLTIPLVIDADGLNNLAGDMRLLNRRREPTVLTPHPGEMARLMRTDVKSVMKDRVQSAKRLSMEHFVYTVLKGARTVVATPGGDVYINPTGNPAMATAGMGDALTGMIAGFFAQGIPATEAIIAAVYIHGLAGDMSAEAIGEVGVITSDLIDRIPKAIQLIKQWIPSERVL